MTVGGDTAALAPPIGRPVMDLPLERARIRLFDVVAIGVLLVAAASTYAAPVVGLPPAGPWHVSVFGGVDLVVAGLAAAGAAAVAGSWGRPLRRSTLDGTVLALCGLLCGVHLVALVRGEGLLLYELADVRRLAMVIAGYLVVTRLRLAEAALRRLVWTVAGVLLAHAAWLTLRHGILGDTQFATSSGRRALLVTEDTLLLMIPVVLLFGRVVDRLAGRRAVAALVLLLPAVLLVELLSLRRGALIFLLAALALRSLWLPRRVLIASVAVAAVLLPVALAGPARGLSGDLSYAVRSSLLLTADDSTSQRRAELEDFRTNVDDAAGMILGRGIGAAWIAEASRPLDVVSFGDGETAAVRVGWHVYGLDWLYRIGLLGGLVALGLMAAGALRVRDRLRTARDPATRSVARSAAVVAPALVLFALTNPRTAFFAGAMVGVLSALADRASADPR